MRVEFLGTGGYFPNKRRQTVCVFLPETGLVFDAGSGLYRVRQHLQTSSLDILLSHAHLDHIMGLITLVGPMMRGRLESVRVHGTPETLRAVTEHLLAYKVFPICPRFEFHPLGDRIEVAGDGTVNHMPLEHPGGSTGYRVDFPDRSLAYITDTTVDGTYTEFVQSVDLLIHECYFPDERAAFAKVTGHSCTTPVATLARDASAGSLALVHVDPEREDDDPIDLEKARAIFPAATLCEDGDHLEF